MTDRGWDRKEERTVRTSQRVTVHDVTGKDSDETTDVKIVGDLI